MKGVMIPKPVVEVNQLYCSWLERPLCLLYLIHLRNNAAIREASIGMELDLLSISIVLRLSQIMMTFLTDIDKRDKSARRQPSSSHTVLPRVASSQANGIDAVVIMALRPRRRCINCEFSNTRCMFRCIRFYDFYIRLQLDILSRILNYIFDVLIGRVIMYRSLLMDERDGLPELQFLCCCPCGVSRPGMFENYRQELNDPLFGIKSGM